MSQWSAVKKIYQMAKKLHQQKGGFTLGYFFDGIICGYRHEASPENYFVLRFYELSDKERGEYLTSGRSSKADKALNRHMTDDENKIMSHKHLLYERFSCGIKRKYLFVPEVGFEEFCHFLDANPVFIKKPDRGIMGKNIEKMNSREIKDKKALYEECQKDCFLIEQVIKQHEVLENITPGCVNSIRINAARGQKGNIRLVGVCLKCGGAGATTDNFHSGGIAYPVDLESGKVMGPGRNNADIKDYERHPGSEVYMIGLQIPYWIEVKEMVKKMMENMPALGYVGWDIAIREDGPEVIEGNCHWPGGNIIQFDKKGKYPIIKECLEEAKCQEGKIF